MHVHLGRIYLYRKQFDKARRAYLDALASDPFDEEIHLSLLRIESALGAKSLAQRARSASIVLTGLPADRVDRIANALGKTEGELVQAGLPAEEMDGSPGPGGTPKGSLPADGGQP
jgi:hypothetical protein